MTRLALVAVGALAVVGSASAGSAGLSDRNASLTATDLRPLVVRGTGFEPGERVRLLLSTPEGQRWRVTDANPSGRFTIGFGTSVDACGRFMLQAFGTRGNRARLFPRGALVDCISPNRGSTVGGPFRHDRTK